MKANELMVGDWVYKPKYNGDALTYIVEEVEADDLYLGRIYDFKPIPLTAEILENNGFEKQSAGGFLLEDEEYDHWVKFYPKDTNYTHGAYSYIDMDCGCMSIREMPIDFLHELQHALRLCGIDKEIVI